MDSEIAQHLDELLQQGVAWPDAVESACIKFNVANREYVEQVYDNWLEEQNG